MMELTQENFDTLMSKSQGLEKALQESRADKKTQGEKLNTQIGELQGKFKDIEKGEETAREQDLIKKGKLEQLLEQKNSTLQGYEATMAENAKKMEEMTGIVTQFNAEKTVRETKMLEQVATKLEGLSPEKRDVVLELIKDKPIEKQLAYTDQLLGLQVTPDYKANAAGGEKPVTDPTGEAYNKAKQSGDLLGMIRGAKSL